MLLILNVLMHNGTLVILTWNLSYPHTLEAGVVHKSEKFASLKRHFYGPIK